LLFLLPICSLIGPLRMLLFFPAQSLFYKSTPAIFFSWPRGSFFPQVSYSSKQTLPFAFFLHILAGPLGDWRDLFLFCEVWKSMSVIFLSVISERALPFFSFFTLISRHRMKLLCHPGWPIFSKNVFCRQSDFSRGGRFVNLVLSLISLLYRTIKPDLLSSR